MTNITNQTDHRLSDGVIVKRKSDGVEGVIEKFGHRFGKGGRSAYNAYYVRWSDGRLGYPNESDFEVCA